MDTEWLKGIVRKFHHDGLISKIVDINITPMASKGGSYFSVIKRIKMKVTLKGGQQRTMSLIMKNAPEGDGQQRLLELMGGFKRETIVYVNVLKEMENLLSEQDVIEDKIWPELIAHRPYDMLLFEDLAAQNYRILPRRDCQDLDHARLALSEIGRFHAMGKVLLAQGKISEKEFGPFFMVREPKLFEKIVVPSVYKMGEVVKNSWGPEWVDIGDRLIKYGRKFHKIFPTLGGTAAQKFKVFNQGDLWTCNMLFKHTMHDDKPISLRMIDYPLAHVDSFGWDLIYYMINSIEADVRRAEYKNLLNIYHKSFERTLLKLGSPPADIPTFDEIIKEMDRLKPLWLANVCFFKAILTANCDDAWDANKVMDAQNIANTVAPKAECFSDELFKKRVGPDLEDFVKIGLL